MVATSHSLTSSLAPLAEMGEVAALLKGILGQKRVILASNRGPVKFTLDRRGELAAQRGQGGLVTALTSLLRYGRVAWVASCMGAGDREAARRLRFSPQGHLLEDPLRLRLVNVAARVYRRHYQVFANPILWLVQHSMADRLGERPAPLVQEAWRWGYLPVNRSLARGILEELGQDDTAPWVFIHDYQLHLAGYYVRQRAPGVLLHHFNHIPWPAPGEGLLRLGPLWQRILRGLLANDVVGFQTQAHADNFLGDCQLSLPEARVDPLGGTLFYRGRAVQVRVYPISVDVAALREQRDSPEVSAYRRKLEPLCGEKTIVKVERLDPTKNTVASLQAFRLLLESHPDLVGKVRLLAFLVPSRTGIPEYRRFGQQVMAQVESINRQFARDGCQPIHVFYENNYPQALAAMTLYDVLLVNPVADGMNLVAKEGPIVNQKDGVLVLSQGAGAHAQLSHSAISVCPNDAEGTAQALLQALSMPPEERRCRAYLLRRSIEEQDLAHWFYQQFRDMLLLSPGGSGRRVPGPGEVLHA